MIISSVYLSMCHTYRGGNQEPLSRIALHHYSIHTEPSDTVCSKTSLWFLFFISASIMCRDLSCHSLQGQQMRRATASSFCSHLLSSTLMTHRKQQTFEQLWPQVMSTLVHQTLQQFSSLDEHMKSMLDNL